MFCSKCGSAVNDKTGKCSGCGKKYLRIKMPSTQNIIILALVVSNLIFVCMYVGCYDEKQEYVQTVADLTVKSEKLNSEILSLTNDLDKEKTRISAYEHKLRTTLAFKTPSGEKYHQFDCHYLEYSNRYSAIRITDKFPLDNQYCLFCWS